MRKGIVGLSDASRRPHNIKHKKVTPEVEETIIDLRLTTRARSKALEKRENELDYLISAPAMSKLQLHASRPSYA
jgi:hypothetical protein